MLARCLSFFFFFQAEDGIRDHCVTGVQTCALPILSTQTTSRKASDPSKATITSVSLAAMSCFCFSVKAPAASLTVTSGMTCSFCRWLLRLPRWRGGSGLGVLLYEGQGDVGDFPPAVVDGEGMPAAGDLDDLGDVGVALLPLVRGVSDGP